MAAMVVNHHVNDVELDSHTCDADEIQQGKLLFRSIDVNGDGEIEPHELLAGLIKLGIRGPGGCTLSLTHAHSMVVQADANGNGTIDEQEFLVIVSSLRERMEQQQAEDANRNSRSPKSEDNIDLQTLMAHWGGGGHKGGNGEQPAFFASPTSAAIVSPPGAAISDVTGLSPSRKWHGLHDHVADRSGSEALLHKTLNEQAEAAEREKQRAAQQEALDATRVKTRFSRHHSMVLKPGDRPADTPTDGQTDGAAASVDGGLTLVEEPAPDGKSEDDAGGFACSIICFGE